MRVFDVRSLGEVAFEAAPAQVTRADVAVIIPLYNYGLYIVDCLQSVVDQTLELVWLSLSTTARPTTGSLSYPLPEGERGKV